MGIPDNYDLWLAHEAESEEELENCPLCDCCGERIQDEHYYDINGEYYCEECLIENFRRFNY